MSNVCPRCAGSGWVWQDSTTVCGGAYYQCFDCGGKPKVIDPATIRREALEEAERLAASHDDGSGKEGPLTAWRIAAAIRNLMEKGE